ncbi:methylaspartate ammonia-lyase [Acidimicrobiaceae bacterium USS-CC1]|uniref:methylaspartate ammonia-lyase n=1 Tax=Acidiferrimicrobium australe TaxID=2664430 RepID=A0ABW9QTN1_9ACTN|nr:methylaspartate ammonia-lyase [Acidiferrimicrobium australe]
MEIADVLCVPGLSGFFADDQAAIRAGAARDGFDYAGGPLTPGFDRIRQPGRSLSVMLVLDDGQVAVGDCATVQYAGAGGREAAFHAAAAKRLVEERVAPELVGRTVDSFRELDAAVFGLPGLPAAVRYGVSQALLDAAARARRTTMAEVVRDEWATGSALRPVPVFVQSGDDRYTNVDKMILKGVDVLPHGLINNVEDKLGADGGRFADYVGWVRDRILRLRADERYRPALHFDTYGTIGLAFGDETDRIARYLAGLVERAAPFTLRIEHPVDAGSRSAQVDAMVALRAALAEQGAPVQLVVDEWCNTLEDIEVFVAAHAADMVHVKTPDLGSIADTVTALLHVRDAGLLSYCGGTCNETDRSAQVCAQVAMACDADQVLAKPGMGVDEGLMIVVDEMARTAALAARRAGAAR